MRGRASLGVIGSLALCGALVAACMVAPPGHAYANALVALTAAGVAALAFAVVLAWEAARHARLARDLHRHSVQAVISGHAVRLIDGRGGPFVAGLVRPRIYVPADALMDLSAAELRAVLAHESWHQREHAPVRLLVLMTLRRFLGRIGWDLAELDIAQALLEVRADKHALDLGARRSTLASALLAVAEDRPLTPVAAFGSASDLRLQVLLGDIEMAPRRSSLWWSAAVATTIACLAPYLG